MLTGNLRGAALGLAAGKRKVNPKRKRHKSEIRTDGVVGPMGPGAVDGMANGVTFMVLVGRSHFRAPNTLYIHIFILIIQVTQLHLQHQQLYILLTV